MDIIGHFVLKLTKTGQKEDKIGKYRHNWTINLDQKWTNPDQNWTKLTKNVQNGPKLVKLDKMDKNETKIIVDQPVHPG